MKSRRALRIIWLGAGVGLLLLVAPIVAGYWQIGVRDGPVFYPEGIHSSLYIIGHEAATDIKPRMALTWVLYDRPLFWGLSRRPKPESERQEYILRAADRRGADSAMVEALAAEEAKIQNGQQAAGADH